MVNTRKTAIVTGASQGIGAGVAQAFLERGYNVVANSRNITRANPFAASANVELVDGDIGDPKTAAKIVDTALSRFGRVDVLVNNAGIFIPKPFTEYTTEDFNALVSTTLAGFLYVTQLSVKQMVSESSSRFGSFGRKTRIPVFVISPFSRAARVGDCRNRASRDNSHESSTSRRFECALPWTA